VLEIRDEVLPYLRPGVSCAEAYEVAQQGYVQRGFGDYLPGRIGHGVAGWDRMSSPTSARTTISSSNRG
jgi:Xaa-Pro aminopeptidase